jgi:hypothetical protein
MTEMVEFFPIRTERNAFSVKTIAIIFLVFAYYSKCALRQTIIEQKMSPMPMLLLMLKLLMMMMMMTLKLLLLLMMMMSVLLLLFKLV